MKESLVRMHVHELEPVEAAPEAANDNVEMPLAASDNEPIPAAAANDNEAVQQIAEVRDRLGLSSVEASQSEKSISVPAEVLYIESEPELESKQESLEIGQSETINAESQPETAQAAGGAVRTEGGEGKGSRGDGHEESAGRPKLTGGGTGGAPRLLGYLGKGLKYVLLAPVWALGALVALSFSAVIKATNKLLEKAKLSQSKEGGGSGKKDSKSSGGGGGHGSGH